MGERQRNDEECHTDLTVEQIVKADALKNHPNVDPSTVFLAFNIALHHPHVKMFRHGNSILVIDTDGDFHFINAEKITEFTKNVLVLLAQAKEAGFKDIHTNFTNPKIIEVAKAIPYEWSITTGEVNGKQQYLLTVRL